MRQKQKLQTIETLETSCDDCVVQNCPSRVRITKNVRFYTFPTHDPLLCEEWLTSIKSSQNVQTVLHSKMYVCSKHFQESDFSDSIKKTLKINAIPTLNIPSEEKIEECEKNETVQNVNEEQLVEKENVEEKNDEDPDEIQIIEKPVELIVLPDSDNEDLDEKAVAVEKIMENEAPQDQRYVCVPLKF